MTAQRGRDLLLKISDGASPEAFTGVAGLRATSLAFNSAMVDITNADSAGHWRELRRWRRSMLVEDWKRAWRWFSVQAMAAALALQGAWASLPDEMKAHVPGWLVTVLSLALLLLGLFGRLVKQ